MKIRARTPIKDGEWVVISQLEVGGEKIGEPLELRYSEAYLAKGETSVGYLIASAMNERAAKLKPLLKKAKK